MEWMKYYMMLDMVVYVYDRDGLNKQYIDELFNSSDLDHRYSRHFYYYDYTIRSLLDSSSKNFQYDNTEFQFNNSSVDKIITRRKRFEMQGMNHP